VKYCYPPASNARIYKRRPPFDTFGVRCRVSRRRPKIHAGRSQVRRISAWVRALSRHNTLPWLLRGRNRGRGAELMPERPSSKILVRKPRR